MAGSTEIDGRLICNFNVRGRATEGVEGGASITTTYNFIVEYTLDGNTRRFEVHNGQQNFTGTLTTGGVLKDSSGNDGITFYVNSNNSANGGLLSHSVLEDDVELTYKGTFKIVADITDTASNLLMSAPELEINGLRLKYEINATYDWMVDDVTEWVDEDDPTWYGSSLAGSLSVKGEGYKNQTFEVSLSKTETNVDGVIVDGSLPPVSAKINSDYSVNATSPINVVYTGENEDYNYSLEGTFDLSGNVKQNITQLIPSNIKATRKVKTVNIFGDYVWDEGSTEHNLTGSFSSEGICKKGGLTNTLDVVPYGSIAVDGVAMEPITVPQTINVYVTGDTVTSDTIHFEYQGANMSYNYGLAGDFSIGGTVDAHDYIGNITITTGGKKYIPIAASYDWSTWSSTEGDYQYYTLAGYFEVAGQCYQEDSNAVEIKSGDTMFNNVTLSGVTVPTTTTASISKDLEVSSTEFDFEYEGADEDYEYDLTGKFKLDGTASNHYITPIEIIPNRTPITKYINADYVFDNQTNDDLQYYELAGTINVNGSGIVASICDNTTITATTPITIDGVELEGSYTNTHKIYISESNEVSFNNNEHISLNYTGSDGYGNNYTLTGWINFTDDSTTKSHALIGEINIIKNYIGYHKGWSEEMKIDTLYPMTLSDTTEKKAVVSLIGDNLTYADGTTFNLATDGSGATTTITTQPAHIKSPDFRNDGMFAYTALAEVSTNFSELVNATNMFNGCENLVIFKATDGMDKLTNVENMFSNCYNLTAFYGSMASLENANDLFNGCGKLEHIVSDMHSVTTATNMLMDCTSLKKFASNLTSLVECSPLFKSAQNTLEEVESDMSAMTDSSNMFVDFSNLKSFVGDLSSLTTGNNMFQRCTSLTKFDADVPLLESGRYMFPRTQLAGWNLDNKENRTLSNLKDGYTMFFNCSEFAEFNGDLSNLAIGYCMFDSCPKLTSFENNLSNLEDGYQMFCRSGVITFSTPSLKSLTNAVAMFRAAEGSTHPLQTFTVEDHDMNAVTDGTHMFQGCSSLQSFYCSLASMTQATAMFQACSSLKSFTSESLESLKIAHLMFHGCSSLTEFNATVPNLENADNMFELCSSLSSVTIDMPSVTTAKTLFNNCSALEELTIEIPNVTSASNMLSGCSSLTTFYGTLSSLTDASNMFSSCSAITTITAEMPEVTTATNMLSGCSALQTWEGSLAKLVDAKDLFKSAQGSLTTVSTDLSAMTNGTQMFNQFTNLSSYSGSLTNTEVATEMFAYTKIASFVDVDLSSLKIAPRMFSKNTVLTTFDCDLPAMTNSIEDNEAAGITNWKPKDAAYPKNGLFNECAAIQSFSGDLSNLVSGYKMFYNCKSLTSFNVSEDGLKSLECGACMFLNCGDTPTGEERFTSFKYNLGALKDGYGMFWGIDTLTEFYAGEEGLKSLERGVNMFSNCRLDGASVEHILTTIPDYEGTPILPAGQLPANEEEGKGYLQICMQPSAAETFVRIYTAATGVTPTLGTDGVYSVDGAGWMDFRGWKIGAMVIN